LIPMRLIFRADASRSIGSGHVMRVTTIAQEAIGRGYECHFVGSTSDLPWVNEFIHHLGFKSVLTDAEKFLCDPSRDILILDSYTVPLDSKFNELSSWRMVICIQDAFTPKYNADIYVNQSLKVTNSNSYPKILTGPDFALIRQEITKPTKTASLNLIPRVLVLGGGSDPFGFVPTVLSYLQQIDVALELHVFSNDDLTGFRKLNFAQHRIGPELDSVAAKADVVITTASTSSIEFIARELPTLVACVVDNQEAFYSELSDLGYAIPIGGRSAAGDWNIDLEVLSAVLKNPLVRDELKSRIRGVIDLIGTSRVVDAIEKWILEKN
jgi:spore coat polysaccharide biosynthesis predicted glycosyltransferase SpsG